MENSYLDVLERIANALEQQNGIPIWEILINIIPWIGVIIPIVVLFIERGELKDHMLKCHLNLCGAQWHA